MTEVDEIVSAIKYIIAVLSAGIILGTYVYNQIKSMKFKKTKFEHVTISDKISVLDYILKIVVNYEALSDLEKRAAVMSILTNTVDNINKLSTEEGMDFNRFVEFLSGVRANFDVDVYLHGIKDTISSLQGELVTLV